MAKVLVTEESLESIAEAIRTKKGVQTQYKPGEMAAAVMSIETPILETLTANANGNYTPSSGKNGFSSATVNVPNSYAAADEGKVVHGGVLVAQTARSSQITENGTYDTTNNNSVTVNVSGGGGSTYIEEWDFTGTTPATGKVRGISANASNITYAETGAVFNGTSNYLNPPVAFNGIMIELDVASMELTSGTHRRFIMGGLDKGLIYRSTGVWSFYNGSWVNSSETSGSFFDGATVKVVIDKSGYWHIYKNGSLWWEPNIALNVTGSFYIGSNSSSINDVIISGMRVY